MNTHAKKISTVVVSGEYTWNKSRKGNDGCDVKRANAGEWKNHHDQKNKLQQRRACGGEIHNQVEHEEKNNHTTEEVHDDLKC